MKIIIEKALIKLLSTSCNTDNGDLKNGLFTVDNILWTVEQFTEIDKIMHSKIPCRITIEPLEEESE